MDNIQLAAASVISQVMHGRNLNQVLNEQLAAEKEFTPQQKGALQDLSYGSLRFYGQLASVLDALLNKPIEDEQIRYLLLIALYQLNYSKAARHAVVDFAVKAVRKIKPSASGLVNAILRNFLRNQATLLDSAKLTEEGLYSYPAWWIKEIKSQYGAAAAEILLAGNQRPPMTLRVNCSQTSTAAYLKLLTANNIGAQLIAPDAILLEHPLMVDRLPGFFDGVVSVQDAGAQYAAAFLDIEDGMRVLDACAAPGGKSSHMLELSRIELHALDKDAQRLERVRENMQRLNLQANLIRGDAAQPQNWWDGIPYQRILADVPCSATGVVRRHPDIKWLRRAADLEIFAKQQLQILTSLWAILQTGGKMLYATCSVFGQENQQLVDKFLRQQPDAKQLLLSASDLHAGQILPNDQHDGFFYALLYKQP
ncbi:MAG: 16S rRNA (cytosine(967)-C(5))-methyltransferase RsmB [Gallionellaceae bacterium]|jgi:16S rRNA (cytosine967-C5)-methyltransferase